MFLILYIYIMPWNGKIMPWTVKNCIIWILKFCFLCYHSSIHHSIFMLWTAKNYIIWIYFLCSFRLIIVIKYYIRSPLLSELYPSLRVSRGTKTLYFLYDKLPPSLRVARGTKTLYFLYDKLTQPSWKEWSKGMTDVL